MKNAVQTQGAYSRSKRAKTRAKRVAGQPLTTNERYVHLLVNDSPEVAKALSKLNRHAPSQRAAVEEAILNAAKRV